MKKILMVVMITLISFKSFSQYQSVKLNDTTYIVMMDEKQFFRLNSLKTAIIGKINVHENNGSYFLTMNSSQYFSLSKYEEYFKLSKNYKPINCLEFIGGAAFNINGNGGASWGLELNHNFIGIDYEQGAYVNTPINLANPPYDNNYSVGGVFHNIGVHYNYNPISDNTWQLGFGLQFRDEVLLKGTDHKISPYIHVGYKFNFDDGITLGFSTSISAITTVNMGLGFWF